MACFRASRSCALRDSISVTDGEITAGGSTEPPLEWGSSGVWPAKCINIPTNKRQEAGRRLKRVFKVKTPIICSSTISLEHSISIEVNIFCHLTVEVTLSRSGLSVPYRCSELYKCSLLGFRQDMLVLPVQVYRMGGLGEYIVHPSGVALNETKSFYAH